MFTNNVKFFWIIYFKFIQMQNQEQAKYKTMLCKHFDTPKGCVYKDKCQFAHGANELKSTVNVII